MSFRINVHLLPKVTKLFELFDLPLLDDHVSVFAIMPVWDVDLSFWLPFPFLAADDLE